MRAQEFVTELFQPGKDWKWSFTGSEEAVAVFHVGDIPYQFHAYTYADEDPTVWEVEFKNASRNIEQRSSKFGLTGTGNSAQVMSTVADIMREFLQRYQGSISQLTFTADEPSRQALYARMARRLLPNWEIVQSGKNFTLAAPETVTEDWGIKKYPIPLPIGDYLSHEDHEFAPPGNYQDVFVLHDEVGDLIDAGVEPGIVPVDPKQLLATQDWLSNDGGGEPLFPEYPDRPVVYEKNGKYYILDGHHRTTKAWKTGRPISVYLFTDQPDNELDENFADGRNPGRKGLSKRVGIPKKATLGKLEKIAKNSTGERRRMAQWQLNMRRGRAK